MIVWIEFLGPYAAADVAARDKVEWPPHPDRLFQALVEAAQPEDRHALEWLESQPPPALLCGEAVPLEFGRGKAYVPVNYPDAGLPEARDRQARTFPLCWPEGPIGLVWPDPQTEVFESLACIAARVSHVGRAESAAIVSVQRGSRPPVLVPDARGEIALRVPHPGRLADLDAAFAAGRRSPTAPSIGYTRAAERAAEGPWAELIALRLARPLSLERVVDATDALRRAVLSRLGDAAPALAHGHERCDHIAWLGLPNLSPYARGELLGLAMAVPRRADSLQRARCVQALLAVNHIMVCGCPVGIERPTQAMSLAARTWTRPDRRWVTATAVVLDRFPKRKITAEQIVAESVVRAGYPMPTRVHLSPDGPAMTLPAARFRLRRAGRLYAHATIEFDRPVRGPLLVGAERYFGLGLFLPVTLARTLSDGRAPAGSRDREKRAAA